MCNTFCSFTVTTFFRFVSTTDQGRDGDSGSSIVGLVEGDRLGGTTGSTGDGNPFSIKQKGYGVYMWRRLT